MYVSGGAAFLREGAENWRRDLGGGQKKTAVNFKGGQKKLKSSYFNPNSKDICWALIDMCIVPLYCGYIVVILSLYMIPLYNMSLVNVELKYI